MEADSQANFPIRLALSHREKAAALLAEVEAAFEQGVLDRSQLEAQQARYRGEQASANAELARYRRLAEAHGETLRAELRAIRHEQAHLPDRVSAGTVSAQRANDRNRELATRIKELRAELQAIETATTADTSSELGGYIDLPFDGYREQILALSGVMAKAVAEESPGLKRWELLAAAAVAAICSVSIVLPWVVRGGVSLSLLESGLDFGMGETNHLARLAWIVYAVMPWLTVVILLRVPGAMLGWFLLGVGIVLLGAAWVPGVLAGASQVHAEDVRQILSAFHVGPLVYMGAALVLIVAGSLRVSPWGDSLAHASIVSLVLAGVVFACAGLFAVFFFIGPARGGIRFDAMMKETGDSIRVVCRNRGTEIVRVAVPWPTGGDNALESYGAGPLYGIRVQIRETGAEQFSDLPYSQDPWSRPGMPFLESPTVEVRPGMDQELILDLRQLSVIGTDMDAVRLVFLRSGGSEVGRFDTPLSGQYLSPSAESREPLFVPRPSTAPAVPTEETAKRVSEGAQPETIERPQSRGWFAFVGAVGDKTAIETWDANGVASGTWLIKPGDPIGEGWYLESVSSAPASIVVHHDPSGTQTTLPRGERMSLSPASVSTP